jgi:hypothetical protein
VPRWALGTKPGAAGILGEMRACIVGMGVVLGLAVSGCGSGVPDASELPLSPGLQARAHEVPGVTDRLNYLLITGPNGVKATVLRRREIAYLHDLGWKADRRFRDGSRGMTSPDGEVRTVVGFGLHTLCGFGGTKRHAPPGYQSVCASLANP